MGLVPITEYKSTTLVQHIADTIDSNSEIKYCFILGAGASKSSGISTGAELSKKWFEDIKRLFPDYAQWMKDNRIEEKNLAKHYSRIYMKRFEINPVEGYEFLQREMARSTPSFGYSILSQLLDKQHNVVITTNFDSLVEDALFLYSENKPLICGHESLSEFVKPTSRRSIIVKVHRDILLNPKNTEGELETLEEGFASSLDRIFHGYIPIVIGYGGNDPSLMGYLAKCNSIKMVFWCKRKGDELSDEITSLLRLKKGKVFEIAGFDELMFQIYAEVFKDRELDKKVKDQAEKRASDWAKQLVDLSKSLTDSESKESLSKITKDKKYRDWWDVELAVSSTNDIQEKDRIFLEGLKDFADSAELNGAYASFLHVNKIENDAAEEYYKKALALNPGDAINNSNYANFLNDIRKAHDAAEKYYKMSISNAVFDAKIYSNYANFLCTIRKNPSEADKYYLKALELDANDSSTIGNYASFLHQFKINYQEAERYYKKALELDPDSANNCSNYAQFLIQMNDLKTAKKYLEKAFNLEKQKPEDTVRLELLLYAYANFHKNYPKAAGELDEMLAKGSKSPGWNFSGNIEKAKEQKHPNLDKVIEYAEKISGNKYH